MRRRERLTVGRTTLTCLPLNVAAVPVLSWRTTFRPSTLSGTQSVLSAGSVCVCVCVCWYLCKHAIDGG